MTLRTNIMTTKQEPNRFTGEAVQHIEEINIQLSDHKRAEGRLIESHGQLEQAKSDVDLILSDVNADAMDCAERLVIGDAMVKVLERRLALNQNSVADRLVSLARAVDGAAAFTMGASGYLARAIRQQKIAKIALELNVNPGKVDPKNIVIDRHPKALAAEGLSSTSRLGQFGNFDSIGANQALQHGERVLPKLQKLAEFEFADANGL
jgi:hypothetical protein